MFSCSHELTNSESSVKIAQALVFYCIEKFDSFIIGKTRTNKLSPIKVYDKDFFVFTSLIVLHIRRRKRGEIHSFLTTNRFLRSIKLGEDIQQTSSSRYRPIFWQEMRMNGMKIYISGRSWFLAEIKNNFHRERKTLHL